MEYSQEPMIQLGMYGLKGPHGKQIASCFTAK